MVQVRKTHDMEFDWEHQRPDEWMEQAACTGKWDLFTLRDATISKWDGYDRAALKAATRICMSCPVFYECEASATEEDLQYTVRAGRMPTSVSTRDRGRPKADPSGGIPGLICIHGHEGSIRKTSDGRKRCYACDRERYAKRAEEKGPAVLKDRCENGHVGMYEREKYIAPGRTIGKRFCRGCKKVNQKTSRGNGR